MTQRLGRQFFQQETTEVARQLVGKTLVRKLQGKKVPCIITETEAYCGAQDKAAHTYLDEEKQKGFETEELFKNFETLIPEAQRTAFLKNFKKEKGKLTARTLPMFLEGGHVYVYLCYGMYNLLNISTKEVGYPEAVLIRGIKVEGIPYEKTNGPGKLTQVLALHRVHNMIDLTESEELWIEDSSEASFEIEELPRVGIDYAEEYKDKPWRYRMQ